MRHHLHHAALNTHGRAAQAAGVAVDAEHDEETQGDETHVGNRGIGDQLFHILLNQRHQADVHHRHQRHGNHQPVQHARRVRGDR